ncbi:MAG: hypothetical protein A3C53_02410 [Omnitrophica WOR_2 bacterium RIFCSPHIGHO2_02_FULL_68_15]|nr:MAG: hypothetical protein A3C53_02410 [Omnitrophica WOR_2 bacterium RIFCSPHIGHO2_02_FULL_68_15]
MLDQRLHGDGIRFSNGEKEQTLLLLRIVHKGKHLTYHLPVLSRVKLLLTAFMLGNPRILLPPDGLLQRLCIRLAAVFECRLKKIPLSRPCHALKRLGVGRDTRRK